MSAEAASVLRTKLAQVEAAYLLMSNPGSSNIDGKKFTQKDLKRVDAIYEASVKSMVKEASCRLLGKGPMSPSPHEEQVWAEASKYLAKRIQATAAKMPGRNPDMSSDAAAALCAVLGQFCSGHIESCQRWQESLNGP